MTKATFYTRVSTIEQAQEDYCLNAQLEQCRAMATIKGWDVAAVYSDDGGLSRTSNRPHICLGRLEPSVPDFLHPHDAGVPRHAPLGKAG